MADPAAFLLMIAGAMGAPNAPEAQLPCRPNGLVAVQGDIVTRCQARSPVAEVSDPQPAPAQPFLEPGFPVKMPHTAGTYRGGQAIHTLVGNIDADPELEIIRTAIATGPMYAWNHDGTIVSGWPVGFGLGPGYPALGELSPSIPGMEVFSGHYAQDGMLVARSGNGVPLPGWPRPGSNFVANPGSLADMDGDGLDEAFIDEQNSSLNCYRADATVPGGWPVRESWGGQGRYTPALVDLDGDGKVEAITSASGVSGGIFLFAYHHDGSTAVDFPWIMIPEVTSLWPALGDVDGDGELEIVVVGNGPMPGAPALVYVLTRFGMIERTIDPTTDLYGMSAPALADLDGDGVLDIIVQTNGALDAWRGDGTLLPGWPQTWSDRTVSNSSPVVGDVTGDGLPEVVVTTNRNGEAGEVRVFDRNGNAVPGFPLQLPIGSGAVPAIADIDLDGRNEIVVSGDYWNGHNGNYDAVWAYDLFGPPHGFVPWGQFMGNARHTGVYDPGLLGTAFEVDTAPSGNSDGNGILEPGESVVLSPTWKNRGPNITNLTGEARSFSGPEAAGVTYRVTDAQGGYGPMPTRTEASCTSTRDCYGVAVGMTGSRAATHWDATLTEQLSAKVRREWPVHIGESFTDVPRADPFYRFVEAVFHHGITAGCSPTEFCPTASVTRGQMAVFVLRSLNGPIYMPPACVSGQEVFSDVPASNPYCRWVEELVRRRVVSGCGGGAFCPEAEVLREQAPVFILRILEGPTYLPPACIPGAERFSDVPATSPFCRWIEELARRGATNGCSPEMYCPWQPVTRGQAGVMLSQVFGFTMYTALWPAAIQRRIATATVTAEGTLCLLADQLTPV